MGLNSQDWGNALGAAVSAYNPQYGTAIASLFGVPPPQQPPQPAQPQQMFTTPAPDKGIPAYIWIGGGVLAVGLVAVLFLARK